MFNVIMFIVVLAVIVFAVGMILSRILISDTDYFTAEEMAIITAYDKEMTNA